MAVNSFSSVYTDGFNIFTTEKIYCSAVGNIKIFLEHLDYCENLLTSIPVSGSKF